MQRPSTFRLSRLPAQLHARMAASSRPLAALTLGCSACCWPAWSLRPSTRARCWAPPPGSSRPSSPSRWRSPPVTAGPAAAGSLGRRGAGRARGRHHRRAPRAGAGHHHHPGGPRRAQPFQRLHPARTPSLFSIMGAAITRGLGRGRYLSWRAFRQPSPTARWAGASGSVSCSGARRGPRLPDAAARPPPSWRASPPASPPRHRRPRGRRRGRRPRPADHPLEHRGRRPARPALHRHARPAAPAARRLGFGRRGRRAAPTGRARAAGSPWWRASATRLVGVTLLQALRGSRWWRPTRSPSC